MFKELREVECCGHVESKEENGLQETEQASGSSTDRPYKSNEKVWT